MKILIDFAFFKERRSALNANVMSLFPWFQNGLKTLKTVIAAQQSATTAAGKSVEDFNLALRNHSLADQPAAGAGHPADSPPSDLFFRLIAANIEAAAKIMDVHANHVSGLMQKFDAEYKADLEFLDLFTGDPPIQDWKFEYTNSDILLDLPGMRLIDISTDGPHHIGNYGVVFAPRAGHHSNIAERTALYLRDQGLTRMAVVEQKCAKDIPLVIDGKPHSEDFESQVAQFKAILEHLKTRTGYPPHLIAVCQPGPLLLTTLILYPELGKTFGAAGSPMHTEAERGMLTDFSRLMGESYIDYLIDIFSGTIGPGEVGEGRKIYDGRLQVLGFYYLGMDQHMKNFRRYYKDLKAGNNEAAERQKEFYQWYNYTHHFPAEFIRDTYKKIFVNNALVRGNMKIGDRIADIKNYPVHVPTWALGGSKDDIVPPRQAVGHLDLIDGLPDDKKLAIIADAGHMGIFRSSKVLKNNYTDVAKFILRHSDMISEGTR
jgi:polyhydroxyalkanoate depolymerase